MKQPFNLWRCLETILLCAAVSLALLFGVGQGSGIPDDTDPAETGFTVPQTESDPSSDVPPSGEGLTEAEASTREAGTPTDEANVPTEGPASPTDAPDLPTDEPAVPTDAPSAPTEPGTEAPSESGPPEDPYLQDLLIDGILYRVYKDYAVLLKCRSDAQTVVLPARIRYYTGDEVPLTVFADTAFDGCGHLQYLKVPEGVTTILFRTFLNCPNLKEVVLPDSLVSLQGNSFENMPGVTVISHANTFAHTAAAALGIPWREGSDFTAQDPPTPTEPTPTEPPAVVYPDIRTQYDAEIGEIGGRIQSIAAVKTHPCIYVTTLNGEDVVSEEVYVEAMVDVFNCPDEFRITAAGGIRVRGNSTVTENEKPYRIKFEEKQNLLGLHAGEKYKNWVLLRTFWNLAPDYMALNLAKTIFGGQYYSSDCMFVNLYLNGESKGIYLLCEQNQAGQGRMEVYEPKKGELQTDIGYVLELDNNPSDEHPFFPVPEMPMPEVMDIAGTVRVLPRRVYSIKVDTRSPEQEAYINRYLNGVYRILYEAAVNDRPMELDGELNPVESAAYATAFDAVAAVMDLESLANMLILDELVQNNDVGSGSFFMAVDFSEDSIYEKLTFLGPWDFNWAYMEDPDTGFYACTFQKVRPEGDPSNSWFILAAKIEGFRKLVEEKWRKLSESGALQATVDRVVAECRTLDHDLGWDAWKITGAENIGNFVMRRIAFLNSQWMGR